jgi:amino acid permease
VGEHGEDMDLVVLHAFHRHSILSLIQVCTSENEIEQTTWCIINSSNVSLVLMIMIHLTFESRITNMVVSELMMSLSSMKNSASMFHAPNELKCTT